MLMLLFYKYFLKNKLLNETEEAKTIVAIVATVEVLATYILILCKLLGIK